MRSSIIGISGSPVVNSNTDRLVMAVLEASGLDVEFVKLSRLRIGPCHACKRCVEDNTCRIGDDFPALAEKMKSADGYVFGAYCPYGAIDAFSRALLERLWSMRHVRNLNRGKPVATVVTGLSPQTTSEVSRVIAREIAMERMRLVGQIEAIGNVPCLTCGRGDDCEMSAVKKIHGADAQASAELCVPIEERTDTWEAAVRLGRELGNLIRSGA